MSQSSLFRIQFRSQIEANIHIRAGDEDYKLAVLRRLWNDQLEYARRNGFEFLCDDIDIVAIEEVAP